MVYLLKMVIFHGNMLVHQRVNWCLVKFIQILNWSSDDFAHWKLRLKTSTQCHTLLSRWQHLGGTNLWTIPTSVMTWRFLLSFRTQRIAIFLWQIQARFWTKNRRDMGTTGKRDWFVAKMGDTQNMFLVGSSGLVSDHPFDVGVSYFQIYPNNQTMVILMGKLMNICMTIHDMFGFPRIFRHTPPIYCLVVRNYLAAAHWWWYWWCPQVVSSITNPSII